MRRTVGEIVASRCLARDNAAMNSARTPHATIRFATRDDVPFIVSLIRELAGSGQHGHLAAATPERLAAELFGDRPACECLIGEQDGAPAAFALFFHNFSTFLCRKGLYLEDLVVRPAARGAGLGKALLRRLAQIAVERECGRFEGGVSTDDAGAQAFYQRMGATLLSDWRVCRVSGDALEALGAAPSAPARIRAATPADVGVVVDLIRDLAVYERLEHLATATPERLAIELFGDRPTCECVIGEQDGEPVGFALYFHNFSTWQCRRGLYLEDLFVRPAARGTGMGKLLLRHLAQIAVARGCGRFEWSVLDWNVDAQAFYQRMGATLLPDLRICRVAGDALRALGSPTA
jgi:GNAT superfamily N-acetyltransferase